MKEPKKKKNNGRSMGRDIEGKINKTGKKRNNKKPEKDQGLFDGLGGEIDRTQPIIEPIHIVDPKIIQAPTQVRRLRDPRKYAEWWIKTMPEAYAAYAMYANREAKRRRRFGINLIRELVRWYAPYDFDGIQFKVPNTISPYIARKLIEDYPHMAKAIQCRKTKY